MNDIYAAAAEGNLEYIKKHEKDISVSNERGWTLLHYAAHFDQLAVAEHLIRQGINVHATNENGKTAEQVARQRSNVVVANAIARATTPAKTKDVNVFDGSPLNRYSWYRGNAEQLCNRLESSHAKFILFSDLDILLDERRQPYFATYDDVKEIVDRPERPTLVFLGIDERNGKDKAGVPFWTLDVSPVKDQVYSSALDKLAIVLKQQHLHFLPAIPNAFQFDRETSAIFAQARAMVDWHTRNRFCPACGCRTMSAEGGHKRVCSSPVDARPACSSLKGVQNFTYPRTDPVIIVCIVHPTEDKVLMGRQKRSPPDFYTCIAGFVEAAESVEAAVRREAYEETGIELAQVEYHSSQPWPFPNSLMFGFLAKAASTKICYYDKELEDARWFTRAEVIAALDKKGNSLKVPPSTAIAHRLLRSWATDLRHAKM